MKTTYDGAWGFENIRYLISLGEHICAWWKDFLAEVFVDHFIYFSHKINMSKMVEKYFGSILLMFILCEK